MSTEHCQYRFYLNNRIHKFTFVSADEQAVDEFFVHLERAMAEHEGDEPMLMLTDLRPDGIPPFNYTLQTARRFFQSHPDRPALRAAYVYERSALITIIRRFFGLLRLNSERRFFEGDELEAIEWVTSGQNPFPAYSS